MGEDGGALSRRRFLAVAGTAGVTGASLLAAGAACGGEETARRSAARRRMSVAAPSPPPRQAPPPSWTRAPLTAAHRPVFDLRQVLPAPPPNAIALTIDDGPHPEWTPRMLDLLARHGVPATFSVIGAEVKRFPKLVERIAAAGHQVANHTMHHPSPFAALPHARIRAEMAEARVRIEDAAGYAPRFFRSPGGDWNAYTYDQCAEQGMIPIDWDVDPRDWATPGARHIERALLKAGPGDIVLCHDGGGDRAQTIAALSRALPALKRRGLTFVSL
ncbi:polysaccharide deacetylase family protein [Actinomadura parmotrematis]|uniref:Polysaccharide deacetylase family protein n=1 Tax=Actinomadura parmotrematis TaxID=2864039 RepID=A0ABS7FM26_9ACTN|nr:polysaccharide deacetylase family protein [Actinomadura parmotrematis]MBW8481285.1 polysaccharide deacetylase family protein [Actinomadura parmotrematis]